MPQGVFADIYQRPLQMVPVREDSAGIPSAPDEGQRSMLFLNFVDDRSDEVRGVQKFPFQLVARQIHSGKKKEVADQPVQQPGLFVDDREVSAAGLFVLRDSVSESLDIASNGGDRRSEIMGKRGHEFPPPSLIGKLFFQEAFNSFRIVSKHRRRGGFPCPRRTRGRSRGRPTRFLPPPLPAAAEASLSCRPRAR